MEGVKLTKADLVNIISWGVLVESTDFVWNKTDSKLMLKVNLLLKEYNHNDYINRSLKQKGV